MPALWSLEIKSGREIAVPQERSNLEVSHDTTVFSSRLREMRGFLLSDGVVGKRVHLE